jgi:hypothetical protein
MPVTVFLSRRLCHYDVHVAVAVTAANRPAIETEEVKSWPHVEQSFWAEQYRKSALSSARKESTMYVAEARGGFQAKQ